VNFGAINIIENTYCILHWNNNAWSKYVLNNQNETFDYINLKLIESTPSIEFANSYITNTNIFAKRIPMQETMISGMNQASLLSVR
jgi:hypothetical protein